MKIALYSESPAVGPGGAEHCVAVLAEALSASGHQVEVVHHKPAAAVSSWGAHSGCDLTRVTFRYSPPTPETSATRAWPWSRARAARRWRAELSAGSDLFIAFLHNRPPFCQAPRGVLITLFPTFKPGIKFPNSPAAASSTAARKKKTKKSQPLVSAPPSPPPMLPAEGTGMFRWDWFHRRFNKKEWSDRLATYQLQLSISRFTQTWTRKRWGLDTQLLYPPVTTDFPPGPEQRSDTILSVGRFASSGHSKNQPLMLETFRQLSPDLPNWNYRCIGGLSDDPADHRYFAQCEQLAKVGSVSLEPNLPFPELRKAYQSATFFWHAAGYGHDEKKNPADAEHFGMTTVEAMAAGCIPLVINKGGQPEIVEHGVSGFVWDRPEELLDFTRALSRDPDRRAAMSLAARERAESFSRSAFLEKFLNLLGPLP